MMGNHADPGPKPPEHWSTFWRLGAAVVVAGALCGEVGCDRWGTPEAAAQDRSGGERPDSRILLQKPVHEERAREERERSPARVVNVAIAELLAEYKDDEARADRQFKGKTVQTAGIVSEVKKDLLGSFYVALGTGKSFEIPEVWCYVGEAQEAVATSLPKGVRVVARGTVVGLMMHVNMRDCTLLQ